MTEARISPVEDGDLAKDRRAAIVGELKRIYEALGNSRTTMIIQYMALTFAAGLVAAYTFPEVFIAIPVIWNAWLLHALVEDINSLKLATYARVLEKKANETLGQEIFQWETVLTKRASKVRPYVFHAFHAYVFLINMAGWSAGITILLLHGRLALPIVAGALCVITWGIAAATVFKRARYSRHFEAVLQTGPSTS